MKLNEGFLDSMKEAIARFRAGGATIMEKLQFQLAGSPSS
jgi:hypothetical protein